MQKRIFIFLFLIFTFLTYSTFAEAALQFLPRCQGGFGSRTQTGGRKNINISCQNRGGVEKKENQICTGAFYVGAKTCYKKCSCIDGYKLSGGFCVPKKCADYNSSYLEANDKTQSCNEVKTQNGLSCYECSACDTGIYKYACQGNGYSPAQEANSCNHLYASCSCSEGYVWDGEICAAEPVLPPADTSEVYTKVISAGACYMEKNYSGEELWGKDVTYELYCHDKGNVTFWGICHQSHVAWYRYTSASGCDACPYHQVGHYGGTGWNCTEEYKREWCE